MQNHTVACVLFFSILCLTLSSCAGNNTSVIPEATRTKASSKISQCKAGDKQVADKSQCLQDDAACYQAATGWCTGPRGITCPSGSVALKKGESCPPGGKCFKLGPSLECAIKIK